MTLLVEDVKWFHVEASSKCNAWCPACPRNNKGFGLIDGLVEQDLTPAVFEEALVNFPALECVQFCGNYGDPIASSYINELVSIAKMHVKKIQIHTNGSLRNANWWHEFANQLADIEHDVWFGIDGLEGVHEIYRQGTDFNKIMQNATSFIDAGGYATWQFIPYKHNEHQTKDCFKLSQKMKFKKFKLAKLYRKQIVAKHYKTGIEFELLPADSLKLLTNINRPNTTVELHNCMHLSIPSVYMSANGKLSRCCYLSNQDRFTDANMLLNTVTDLNDQLCVKSCG
jgi:sulfatase maturation enzyme AslB (radical SAM superfamily)